jgi:hypothetical protein
VPAAGPKVVSRVSARVLKSNISWFLFFEVKGDSMKSGQNGNRIDTTLGKLIATISDVAFEYSDDSEDAYQLAHLVLMEILKDASLTRETFTRRFSTVKYLH